MEIRIVLNERVYRADLDRPLDLSIPLEEGARGVNCFFAPFYETSPVRAGDFVGSIREGGAVNFRNVRINPHGNGTHTECVGHISAQPYSLNDCLRRFHFPARLISIYPRRRTNGDRVIELDQVKEALDAHRDYRAVLIRTLPNEREYKWHAHYGGTNPPYLSAEVAAWLAGREVEHLLVDLPSVDREEDGGSLAAHRAFWQYPDRIRKESTISELIFVNHSIPDGLYLLNIQIASFQIDVSPSKPVIYPLQPESSV